jgi:hypothetical protein
MRQLRSGNPKNSALQRSDVVAGLADLFGEFDDQERQTAEQQGMSERKIVAPTKLRNALQALNPERFSVGAHKAMIWSVTSCQPGIGISKDGHSSEQAGMSRQSRPNRVAYPPRKEACD